MTDPDQVAQEQFDALVERVEALEAQMEVATEGDSPEPDTERDVSEAEKDEERKTIESLGGPWMEGSGVVVRRTNKTIAALLQQDFERFGVDQLTDAIRAIANVESDDTVRKYRERVIDYGPFEKTDGMLWEIQR
jgi:hypothetical protein